MEGNPRLSTAELLIRKRSPERSPIWMEPKPRKTTATKKAAVVYYLSRNGHLEHPHLIEVPLIHSSSPQGGLYLRDVMNFLNMHRGKGMSNMFSWSSKRSYKNGYVWHDLSEDDLIHSTNGHDYILKGTLLVQTSSPDSRSHETNSSTQTPPEAITSGEDSNSPAAIRRVRNQSWSSFDNPQEYVVHYRCESNRELAAKFAADAATQTTDQQRRRSSRKECAGQSMDISREEIMISPPQLNSSEDDGSSDSVSALRDVDRDGEMRHRTDADRFPSGRMKASKLLMQLITCASVSVNDEALRSKQESDFVEKK